MKNLSIESIKKKAEKDFFVKNIKLSCKVFGKQFVVTDNKNYGRFHSFVRLKTDSAGRIVLEQWHGDSAPPNEVIGLNYESFLKVKDTELPADWVRAKNPDNWMPLDTYFRCS